MCLMSNLEIETTRFGTVSVDGDRVLDFHPDCLALPTRPGGFCCSPMKRDASTGSNPVIRKIWLCRHGPSVLGSRL